MYIFTAQIESEGPAMVSSYSWKGLALLGHPAAARASCGLDKSENIRLQIMKILFLLTRGFNQTFWSYWKCWIFTLKMSNIPVSPPVQEWPLLRYVTGSRQQT